MATSFLLAHPAKVDASKWRYGSASKRKFVFGRCGSNETSITCIQYVTAVPQPREKPVLKCKTFTSRQSCACIADPPYASLTSYISEMRKPHTFPTSLGDETSTFRQGWKCQGNGPHAGVGGGGALGRVYSLVRPSRTHSATWRSTARSS